jgi:replicative DNA helicase
MRDASQDTPGRVPPHDLDTERAVLGGGMVSEAALLHAVGELEPEDFYSQTYRELFIAFRASARDNQTQIDHISILPYLPREHPDLRATLFSIMEGVPSSLNYQQYVDHVRSAGRARRALDVGLRLVENCYGGQGSYLDAPEEAIGQLAELTRAADTGGGPKAIRDSVSAVRERLVKAREHEGIIGLRTMIPKLDNLIKGLRDGQYYVIGGRPGMYKSALLGQIALNLARQGYRVLIQSPEMDRDTYLWRMAVSASGLNAGRINDGDYSDEELERIMSRADEIGELSIFVDDAGTQTVERVRLNALRLDVDVVFVDYVQKMTPDSSRSSREEQISQLSQGLVTIGKDLRIPVVVAAQLSRTLESRNDKRPLLSDLRSSGQIEQDADAVMFNFRPGYYDDDYPASELEIEVAKNRHGLTGRVLMWIRPSQIIEGRE